MDGGKNASPATNRPSYSAFKTFCGLLLYHRASPLVAVRWQPALFSSHCTTVAFAEPLLEPHTAVPPLAP